jgi:GrpB-like predicted nucleotidyltransferase (UPF0157 family)
MADNMSPEPSSAAEREADERLRAVTLGEPTRVSGPITMTDYDPGWPEAYEREAVLVRDVLGERALAIQHVGSTSVPGLAAKPVIDMLLLVADSADERSYVPDLETTRYVLRIREPDWHQHRLLKAFAPEVNLHVFSSGCSEVDRMLAFRDHLRADDGDRALYERTKRRLARRTWRYVQDYADAKAAVVEDILSRALRDGGSSHEPA